MSAHWEATMLERRDGAATLCVELKSNSLGYTNRWTWSVHYEPDDYWATGWASTKDEAIVRAEQALIEMNRIRSMTILPRPS